MSTHLSFHMSRPPAIADDARTLEVKIWPGKGKYEPPYLSLNLDDGDHGEATIYISRDQLADLRDKATQALQDFDFALAEHQFKFAEKPVEV
jgi:hypothetical protein